MENVNISSTESLFSGVPPLFGRTLLKLVPPTVIEDEVIEPAERFPEKYPSLYLRSLLPISFWELAEGVIFPVDDISPEMIAVPLKLWPHKVLALINLVAVEALPVKFPLNVPAVIVLPLAITSDLIVIVSLVSDPKVTDPLAVRELFNVSAPEIVVVPVIVALSDCRVPSIVTPDNNVTSPLEIKDFTVTSDTEASILLVAISCPFIVTVAEEDPKLIPLLAKEKLAADIDPVLSNDIIPEK